MLFPIPPQYNTRITTQIVLLIAVRKKKTHKTPLLSSSQNRKYVHAIHVLTGELQQARLTAAKVELQFLTQCASLLMMYFNAFHF